jgi:hypothetical protein
LFEKLNAVDPDQKVSLFAATAMSFEHFKGCHDKHRQSTDLEPAHPLASPSSPPSLDSFDYFFLKSKINNINIDKEFSKKLLLTSWFMIGMYILL